MFFWPMIAPQCAPCPIGSFLSFVNFIPEFFNSEIAFGIAPFPEK